MTKDYRVEEWLSDVDAVSYSDYWNDETEEQNKAFWTLDGNYEKLETYLADLGLIKELEACVEEARSRFRVGLCGVGCDLAAGTLWAEPHLLRLGAEKVYCVEYSRHRLLKIGAELLHHYDVSPSNIVLALGDMNHIHLPDDSLNFVFMSQAFHHSNSPHELLTEIHRALKTNGLVIIIGEHIAEPGIYRRVIQMVKYSIAKLVPSGLQQLIFGRKLNVQLPSAKQPPVSTDDILGDHYYTQRQYAEMFRSTGFRFHRLHRKSWVHQSFILTPIESMK